MEQRDRRASDRHSSPPPFAGQNWSNVIIGAVVAGMLGYAGSLLVEVTRKIDSFATKDALGEVRATVSTLATKEALGEVRSDLGTFKVGVGFDQRRVDDKLIDHTRQIEALQRRAPGSYPSPN